MKYSLPHARGIVFRLLSIQLFSILNSESQEITQLSSSIDLSLPDILALAQHRGSQQLIAILATHEVGRFQEDGRTVGKGHLLPRLLGREGGVDGFCDIRGAGAGVLGDGGGVGGRVRLSLDCGRGDLLAADDEGDVNWEFSLEVCEGFLELCSFRGVAGVVLCRFVEDLRDLEGGEGRRWSCLCCSGCDADSGQLPQLREDVLSS